jgi:hypothetical protein
VRAQISDPIPRVVTRGNAGTDQAVERPMLGTAMEKKASIGNRYCQARRKRKQGKKDKGSLSVVIVPMSTANSTEKSRRREGPHRLCRTVVGEHGGFNEV